MGRDIFLTLGEKFETVLIVPELQSAVRGLTSEASAKALYTSGRTEIHDKLMDELSNKLKPRGTLIEDVLLKGIKLPKQLTDAIELKAQAEQESARMEFVLSKERQEAGGCRYLCVPEDCERGHLHPAAAMEGHRGHG